MLALIKYCSNILTIVILNLASLWVYNNILGWTKDKQKIVKLNKQIHHLAIPSLRAKLGGAQALAINQLRSCQIFSFNFQLNTSNSAREISQKRPHAVCAQIPVRFRLPPAYPNFALFQRHDSNQNLKIKGMLLSAKENYKIV